MPAVFTVDPNSGVPIYLQIIEQIKRCVALGILEPGEQLPTVKQLALDLTINPNTVARAYRDLERDAVIQTAAGRGSFVRNTPGDSPKTAATDIARNALNDALREVKSVGLGMDEVRRLLETVLERWFPEER